MKVEKYLWCRPYVSKVKEWAGCNMTKRTGGPSICNISKVSGTRSGFGKRVNLGFLAVFVSFHHRLGVFLLLK